MEWLMRLPLDFLATLQVLLHAQHPGPAGWLPFIYAGIGFMIVAGLIGLAVCSFLERRQATAPIAAVEE